MQIINCDLVPWIDSHSVIDADEMVTIDLAGHDLKIVDESDNTKYITLAVKEGTVTMPYWYVETFLKENTYENTKNGKE